MQKLNRSSNVPRLSDSCCLSFFWNGITWGIFATLYFTGRPLVGLIITGVLGLIGLLMIRGTFRLYRVNQRFAKPEVWIDTQHLRVGDQFKFIYQQQFKKTTTFQSFKYSVILRETARYRQGTDTVTVHHDHVTNVIELPPQQFETNDMLNDEQHLQIPPNTMHTFEAPNNKLNWFVRIEIDIDGRTKFDDSYDLKVYP